MKKLLIVTLGFATWLAPTALRAYDEDHRRYYLPSNSAPPWDVTNNEIDMTDVFGSDGWRARQYETVDLTRLFSPATVFIFVDGGDNHSVGLASFLSPCSSQIAPRVSH